MRENFISTLVSHIDLSLSLSLSRSVQLIQFDLYLFCIHLQIILNALKIRKSLKSCSWYILIIPYYTILNGCVFFSCAKTLQDVQCLLLLLIFLLVEHCLETEKNMFHLIESNVRIFRHPNFILFYFLLPHLH